MARHEPGRNDPCLCGSGQKFKKCCRGLYSSGALQEFREAFNAGDYDAALLHARHHLTWYVLAYRAHTVPMLTSGPKAGGELLRIDIEAMAEILENIQLCLYRLGRTEAFPPATDALANLISDGRWHAKIAYLRALWHLIVKEDEPAALSALQGIDVAHSTDADLLTLYLDLCSDQLSFTESMALVDRILANTSKESERLQYRVLKALKHYLIGETGTGERLFESALTDFANLPNEKKSSYGKLLFAQALETYGVASDRRDLLEQGVVETNALIRDAGDGFTEHYIADLYKLLGDLHAALGNHEASIDAYTTSLQRHSSELTRAFLARALCNNGEVDRSRQLLEDIDDDVLSAAGRFDLALSWALLAATSRKAAEIEEAKTRLKAVEARDPLFVELRDRWIIELLETKPDATDRPGAIRRLIRSINRYVMLNPNVFGVGINVNRVIDDLERSDDPK